MKPLQLLVLEDNHDDVFLIQRELSRLGYALAMRVEQDMRGLTQALADPALELIISDYSMPDMDALEALAIVKESGRDVPFIVVSGSIGEAAAVEILTRGAADFIIKSDLSRLAPAIDRELREVAVRRARAEAEERMREALEARDNFLSVASHELRTPLTTLKLQLAAIVAAVESKHLLDERLRNRLEIAKRGADRLTDLIDRVLDVTRLASDRASLDMQPDVDLGALVDHVVEQLQPACDEAGCAMQVEKQPGVTGRWDAGRLETVVSNLLTNAIKYGAHRPVYVKVEREASVARLTIRDHGIGIAPEDQARIFDRFERAVSQSHYGGFGIGLWQSRMLVELHGGRIEVRSTPGHGAMFVVELPRGEGE